MRDQAGYFGKFSSSSLAFAMRSWAISSSPCEVARCGHARARRVHVCAISRRYLITSEFMSDFATFDARNKSQRIPARNRDQAAEISQARHENLLFADNFLRLGPRGGVGLSARGPTVRPATRRPA